MTPSAKRFKKRDAILQYLQETKSHPSAETIYAQLKPQIPDLAMGTVYRNLNLFREQGLAMSVATVKGVERFDGNTDPHVHFVCTQCDAVIDLHHIPMPHYEAKECGGCRIESCALTFTGLCGNCQ
jgi:Fur family peroxide stress response transcriptional regulator